MNHINTTDITKIYTNEQIELIKNTVAKGATDDELKFLVEVAQKYGLDPFIKEIWFIKRPKKIRKSNNTFDYPRLPNGEIDYSNAETLIMTSRDGYLKIAQRDENFDGIIGFVVKDGDSFEVDAENYKVSHKFGAKRGEIIGAWAKVDHKKRKPVIVYADFKEYNSETSSTWKQYPSAMILKVAEVLALKRQFGISGLVTKEEMSAQDKDEETPDSINATLESTDKDKTINESSKSKPATEQQRKMIYAKSKEAGLTNDEYKSICERLFDEGKITDISSKNWTNSDIQSIKASLIDLITSNSAENNINVPSPS